MSQNKLTKREALDLITPVVDGEVDKSIREAFFKFIEKNADIRKQYESQKRIKNLTASRCPYFKAPDSLKNKVSKIIRSQNLQQAASQTHFQDIPACSISEMGEENHYSGARSSPLENSLYAAAASLLVLVAFWGLIVSGISNPLFYSIEKSAYQHFMDNRGQFIHPSISTASMAGAQVELSDNYDFPMTIPPLQNAEFKGVVYTDFVPDYKSPLLEYYLPKQNEYIYIFAFKISKLKEFGRLSRSDKAVRDCLNRQDFYVENINGKHVVSWKWDDTWYAAISNHNGKKLASLVEPLNYTLKE